MVKCWHDSGPLLVVQAGCLERNTGESVQVILSE